MGRIAFAAGGVVLGYMAMNGGFSMPDGLEGKFWLVALFPAVYTLGFCLLRD